MAMETTMQQAMDGLQEALQKELNDKEIRVLQLGNYQCIVVLDDGDGSPQCIGVIDIIAKEYDIPVVENPYNLEIISMLEQENWRSTRNLIINALMNNYRFIYEAIADCEGCEKRTQCRCVGSINEDQIIWLCEECRPQSHFRPPGFRSLMYCIRTWEC